VTDWLKLATDLGGKTRWQGTHLCATVQVLTDKKLKQLPELDDDAAPSVFSRVTGLNYGLCEEGISQLRQALDSWPPEAPTSPDLPHFPKTDPAPPPSSNPTPPPAPLPAEPDPAEPPSPPPAPVAEPPAPSPEETALAAANAETLGGMSRRELEETARQLGLVDVSKLTKGELVEAVLSALND